MPEHKKALITGITGQDGSYLAELLISKGYDVHGLIRRSSIYNRGRIEHLYQDAQRHNSKFVLHHGDLTDGGNLMSLLLEIKPDEIYNLGAQSHVQTSFEVPEYTSNVVGLGPLRLLEALRHSGLGSKFYQASSSEMFGNTKKVPQDENTEFNPGNPYGIAKLFAHHALARYREGYNMHATSGILFNHESPRRGENFVTRKITAGIAEILAGKRDKIYLGNLETKRDWGYAPEFVNAMWLMLQQEKPDDYVIATGETHSIREFLDEAFGLAGINNWAKYVGIDPIYIRPVDVNILLGDPTKAKEKLGWEPKVKFRELVKIMLEADCQKLGASLPK